jgi:hypothetical protein
LYLKQLNIEANEIGIITKDAFEKCIQANMVSSDYQYPCGGGVEYLHRDPAGRKRQRNGTKKGRAIA